MKRFLTIILVSVMCVTTVFAQSPHRHRSWRHHSGWENFDRTIHTIDNITSTAMLFGAVAMIDDYTGVRLGMNSASLHLSGPIENSLNSESISGINLGLVFGWYLGHSPIILEPGVYLSLKGGELNASHNIATKYNMTMLEIPLVLKYDIGLGENAGLQPFFGGFMAVGLGGEAKFKDLGESFDTFGEDGFKSFDAGLRMGCGLAVRRLYFEIAYDLGLVNLPTRSFEDFDYDDWDNTIKSDCVSFSIGFNF